MGHAAQLAQHYSPTLGMVPGAAALMRPCGQPVPPSRGAGGGHQGSDTAGQVPLGHVVQAASSPSRDAQPRNRQRGRACPRATRTPDTAQGKPGLAMEPGLRAPRMPSADRITLPADRVTHMGGDRGHMKLLECTLEVGSDSRRVAEIIQSAQGMAGEPAYRRCVTGTDRRGLFSPGPELSRPPPGARPQGQR